jgi:hypothetical protein
VRFRDVPDPVRHVLRFGRFSHPDADATSHADPDADATSHADSDADATSHADTHTDSDGDTDSQPESATTDPQRGRRTDSDARWSARRRRAWR